MSLAKPIAKSPRTLRHLAQLALEATGQPSGRALAAISADYGCAISQATINAMLGGTYKHVPSAEALRALGRMAGVDETVALAIGGKQDYQPFVLPESAQSLTGEQRDAVLAVIWAFVNDNKQAARPKQSRSIRSV